MSQPGFLDKIRVALISTKIRLWDNSIKLNFTKRKSDKSKKRGEKKQNISSSSLYCKGVESVYIDFKSADEKLRNIGSKPSSRTDVPRYNSNEIEQSTLQYPRKIEVATIHTEEIQGTTNESESKMADRNTSRFNVNRGAGNQTRIEIKRRSRSAGPNGKTKQRNSVDEKRFMAAQEKKNKSSRHYQRKQQQTKTRHSMYNEPISDKEGFPDYLGSSSGSESDGGHKKWIKNPLSVKKAKKSQNDKRKSSSYDNADRASSKSSEIKYRNVTDSPELPVRDYYKNLPEKYDNGGQKGKYQRLEELRKKRIDITVTSDEELNSPAYRISRLRQRALQGARGSLKLPDTLDEWDIINNKPRVPEKPRHLEIKREVKVTDIPVENGSSSSEQISLRQIGPGLRTNQGNIRPTNSVHQPLQNIQAQGSYRKIPKQDSVFMNSQNVNNVEDPVTGMKDTAPRLRELPSGGVVRYVNINNSHNAPQHGTGNDKVISFNEVRTNEPVIPKKAIDRVDKKRKSHSDDSLDELIESNIQYLESEIESGKLKQISKMQPGFFPVDSVNNQGRDKRRSASWEGVTRTDDNSFQNEVKLRLQIPSLMTSSTQRSPSPGGRNFETFSNSSPQPYRKVELSNQSSNSLPHQSDVHVVYKTHVFQNTVPKTERKMLSATHSPYLSRKSSDLTEMEDLSKSDSQLSEHTFNYQRPSNYLHPNFRSFQTSGVNNDHESRSDEIKNVILKSMSVPVMESGMFSDVDYDIEVSERIKKWEKLMEKKKSVASIIDDGQQPLTTIIESECTLPEAWQREPETPVPIPQTMSFTSASVTVSRASSSVDDGNFVPQRPQSPVTVKTYFEPKVQSSENSTHRIFRVVQDPRCCKANSNATESELNWVQSPLMRERTPYDNRYENDQDTFVTEESVLRPNITSKQGWPPQNLQEDEKSQKPSRISRFEDELNELQDIKVESVSDLRRRFNSDASGNESTDVTETPATPVRMTPLRQRKQYAQVTTQPQPKKAVEKRILPPQVPPVKVFERKIDKISIAPQSSKSNDTEVWSPNLESKKGLVSIERVTARTLQTIPFSEDPIWREIEEMTNIDKLLASGEEKDSTDQKSNATFDKVPSRSVPHSIQVKSTVRSEIQNPSLSHKNSFTSSSASQDMAAPSGYQQLIKTRPFITPKIQPLKLSVNAKSSVDALDEVLEDIRNSLQKKSSVSDTSSPMIKNQSFFATDSQRNQWSTASKNVVSSVYTHYDPSTYQSDKTISSDHQAVSEPISSDGTIFQNHVQQIIDPNFTQYPHIINGNYQLDPMLLKQKLLGTGLAEERENSSDMESFKRVPPPPPERKHLPTSARNESENTNAEEEVLRSMEELKKLAEDVEQKLRQIKTKIIQSDEGNLDTIVTALRKFAPTVNPKFDPKKFETRDEHFAKKTKLKDALSELERIYDSLDLDDENLLSRAERRETTLPRMTSHFGASQKPGLKRTVSDPDYTGSYGMWQSNYGIHQTEDLDHVERETQREFDCINKSFETLLAEVSQPVDVGSEMPNKTKRDDHVAEINATLDAFLGKYRKNETEMYDSKYDPVKASELANQFKGTKESVPPPSTQISIPNRCRDVLKSEVFAATSGPFSVLVGINGNPRKTRSKVRRSVKKTNQNETGNTVTSKSSSVGTSTNVVQNTSSNESGSKDESESEPTGKPQITKRQKRSAHWQHRKSMPADMLKKSVETQTSDAHWVSPVAVIKEKFQNRNERDTSVSSENSDAQGPRKKQIAKGIAAMMEFFSSSEDERSRRTLLSHSHSAPDLMELFAHEPKKSEKVSSPTSGRPLTPRTVKQRHEARARKRSIDIQNKTSEDKTDEFSVTSATSDDGQKSTSKPPRHPGLRKQKSSSPDKSDTGKTDSGLDRKSDNDADKIPSTDQNSIVAFRVKASDSEERPRSFHELLTTFETDKERVAKMKRSLRKCASADNVLEEIVFRKSYSSEPDLSLNGNRRRASDSGMKLQLEIKVKS